MSESARPGSHLEATGRRRARTLRSPAFPASPVAAPAPIARPARDAPEKNR